MKISAGVEWGNLNLKNYCAGVVVALIFTCLLAFAVALGVDREFIAIDGAALAVIGIYVFSVMAGVAVTQRGGKSSVVDAVMIVFSYVVMLVFAAMVISDRSFYSTVLEALFCVLGGVIGYFVGNIKNLFRGKRRRSVLR